MLFVSFLFFTFETSARYPCTRHNLLGSVAIQRSKECFPMGKKPRPSTEMGRGKNHPFTTLMVSGKNLNPKDTQRTLVHSKRTGNPEFNTNTTRTALIHPAN